MDKVHFSSASAEWATPRDFYDKLNGEFNFELDACATFENAKCANYYDMYDDALTREWHGRVFMNPPYGRGIRAWVEKAYKEAKEGRAGVVVCLLPARTDTSWWHDFCMKGEIRFLRGRLKFGGAKHGAPFPSAVVIFRR